jgi:hypothetical protein
MNFTFRPGYAANVRTCSHARMVMKPAYVATGEVPGRQAGGGRNHVLFGDPDVKDLSLESLQELRRGPEHLDGIGEDHDGLRQRPSTRSASRNATPRALHTHATHLPLSKG